MKFSKPIATFLIAAAIAASFTQPVKAETVVVVQNDGVNVRAGASTDSEILATFNKDQSVTALEVTADWVKFEHTIAANKIMAYISTKYVVATKMDATVTDDNVNVRSQSNTSSAVLGKMYANAPIVVTGVQSDFYSFIYNGATAYIHSDYVSVSNAALLPGAVAGAVAADLAADVVLYATVTSTNGINLRAESSLDGAIVSKIAHNEIVDVTEILANGWVAVSYGGKTGFVSSEFVNITLGVKPNRSIGLDVVDYAKKFLGVRYVYGGTNLKSGVDCSGYTMSIYKNFGITLNRTSRDQSRNGVAVGRNELRPGDLVFFDTNGSNNGAISHVGIYIGDGKFIHASSGRENCVKIDVITEGTYYRQFVCARRVIN